MFELFEVKMVLPRKKLFIGNIDDLFSDSEMSDDDSDEMVPIKTEKEGSGMCDIDDAFLNESYDACVSQLDKIKIEEEKQMKMESEEAALIEAYDACASQLDRIEKRKGSEMDDAEDACLIEACEAYDRSRYKDALIRSVIPRNLEYLMQNSRKEIERNKLLAKLRLAEFRQGDIQLFKREMTNFFYAVETWPNYAINLLFCDFHYHERIALACFLHGNGLRDSVKALRVFCVYNKYWRRDRYWYNKFYKFQELFKYLDQTDERTAEGARLRDEYYYYNMHTKLTMFYDGTIRMPNGEKRRYFSIFGKQK